MNVTTVTSTPNPEETICRAARGDYMTAFQGEMPFDEVMASVDGETIDDKKRSLIHQLLQRGHFGPFEHPSITFGVDSISRVCMAQLTRHRHASFDVQSLRYTAPGADEPITSDSVGEYIVIPPDCRDTDAESALREAAVQSFGTYQTLLANGVRKEDARFALPLATAVNMTVSMNARMLLHLFDMRLKADAQDEIISLSRRMLVEASSWMPITIRYYDQEMSPRKNQLSP